MTEVKAFVIENIINRDVYCKHIYCGLGYMSCDLCDMKNMETIKLESIPIIQDLVQYHKLL